MYKHALVLGAGSSIGYGYPTGASLFSEIIGSYYHDKTSSHGSIFSGAEYKDFIELYQKFPDLNIDRFLRNFPRFEKVGQIFIMYQMLKSEIYLYYNGSSSPFFTSNQDKWYHILLSYVTEKYIKDGIDGLKNWLKIVTFNYDVSLETYLLDCLINTDVTNADASKIYELIKPSHVYGKVRDVRTVSDVNYYGNLKKFGDSDEGRAKNSERLNHSIDKHKNISVIYGNKNTESVEDIKIYNNAENVYFLGFGFDLENMERIGFDRDLSAFFRNSRNHKRTYLFATNYGDSNNIKNIFTKYTNSYSNHANNKIENCSVIDAMSDRIKLD